MSVLTFSIALRKPQPAQSGEKSLHRQTRARLEDILIDEAGRVIRHCLKIQGGVVKEQNLDSLLLDKSIVMSLYSQ